MKSLLFICFFSVGLSYSAAQDVGHLNSTEIRDVIPGKKEADEKLKAEQKRLEAEIEKQKADLQKFYETAQQKQAAGATEAEMKTLGTQFEEKQQRLSQFQQTAIETLTKQEELLYTPLINKMKAAIQTVATKKGLKYVLDSAAENVVLLANGVNITADVKKELLK